MIKIAEPILIEDYHPDVPQPAPIRKILGRITRRLEAGENSTLQYAVAIGAVAIVSLINFPLKPIIGIHATALVFLLGIVFLALFVDRWPTLVAATLSAVVWDYFFIKPVFALRVTDAEDSILLAMYFIVALVLGHLTTRIRAQEKAKRQGEARATALYLLTREFAESTNPDEMLKNVIRQMKEFFKSDVAILTIPGATDRTTAEVHAASTFALNEKEQPIAAWTFRHGCSSREPTGGSSEGETLFLPLTTSNGPLGVICLRLNEPLGLRHRNLLDAFAQQIALALDRHYLQVESEKSKWLAESERLSKTLLNSMSHEIRTPIAVIKNATSNLLEAQETPFSPSQQEMLGEIQEANDRLDRLVGKVLDMTRLESGRVAPKITPCDVRDLVHMAIKETRKELAGHKVAVDLSPDLPLVPMDFVMTQQAVMNLLSNAAIHTPANTAVQLTARAENGTFFLTVADNGPGMPLDSIPRVFDKFYRGPHAPTGGTGLGLSLVKGFIEAQGGRVSAANHPDGGAIFTIRLPLDTISHAPRTTL
jgi:two-component system sensor histidine kinase KdpD